MHVGTTSSNCVKQRWFFLNFIRFDIPSHNLQGMYTSKVTIFFYGFSLTQISTQEFFCPIFEDCSLETTYFHCKHHVAHSLEGTGLPGKPVFKLLSVPLHTIFMRKHEHMCWCQHALVHTYHVALPLEETGSTGRQAALQLQPPSLQPPLRRTLGLPCSPLMIACRSTKQTATTCELLSIVKIATNGGQHLTLKFLKQCQWYCRGLSLN